MGDFWRDEMLTKGIKRRLHDKVRRWKCRGVGAVPGAESQLNCVNTYGCVTRVSPCRRKTART